MVDAPETNHRHPETQQREEEIGELEDFILGEAVQHDLRRGKDVCWCPSLSFNKDVLCVYQSSLSLSLSHLIVTRMVHHRVNHSGTEEECHDGRRQEEHITQG